MDRTACTEPQYLYKGALHLTLYTFHWPNIRSSAAVTEQYSYTSTHPLGHTGTCTGITLPFLLEINCFKEIQ